MSGSEDGTVKIWHSSTYRLENTLNYGLERCWCVAYTTKGNDVGFGFDEGAVVVKVSIGLYGNWVKRANLTRNVAWQGRAVSLDG